jgi:hypothetical protein
MAQGVTWVEDDDGRTLRAYLKGNGMPVAKVSFHRWYPFPGGWRVEVRGRELGGSWANPALARTAAERVLRQQDRARR